MAAERPLKKSTAQRQQQTISAKVVSFCVLQKVEAAHAAKMAMAA
jgi:hypothetical protein